MKHLVFYSTILLISCICLGQTFRRQVETMEKYISVTDKRGEGKATLDTTTLGHTLDEVYIVRTRQFNSAGSSPDRTSSYFIHFYKPYMHKLTCYSMIHTDTTDYDKASYRWLNDSVVYVHMFNSMNPETKTAYKLTYSSTACCSAGLLFN